MMHEIKFVMVKEACTCKNNFTYTTYLLFVLVTIRLKVVGSKAWVCNFYVLFWKAILNPVCQSVCNVQQHLPVVLKYVNYHNARSSSGDEFDKEKKPSVHKRGLISSKTVIRAQMKVV